MQYKGSCRNRRRRALDVHQAGVASIYAVVAPLTRHGTAFAGLQVAGAGAVTLDVASEARVSRVTFPGARTPGGAGERLDLQRLALPLAAWLATSVQGAEVGVDVARVCFRAESVSWDGIDAARGGPL